MQSLKSVPWPCIFLWNFDNSLYIRPLLFSTAYVPELQLLPTCVANNSDREMLQFGDVSEFGNRFPNSETLLIITSLGLTYRDRIFVCFSIVKYRIQSTCSPRRHLHTIHNYNISMYIPKYIFYIPSHNFLSPPIYYSYDSKVCLPWFYEQLGHA
jgi:hypothetical protein